MTLSKSSATNISVLSGIRPYSCAESDLETFFAIFAAAAASVLSCANTYVTLEYCMNAVPDPLSTSVVNHFFSPLCLILPLRMPGIWREHEYSLES